MLSAGPVAYTCYSAGGETVTRHADRRRAYYAVSAYAYRPTPTRFARRRRPQCHGRARPTSDALRYGQQRGRTQRSRQFVQDGESPSTAGVYCIFFYFRLINRSSGPTKFFFFSNFSLGRSSLVAPGGPPVLTGKSGFSKKKK